MVVGSLKESVNDAASDTWTEALEPHSNSPETEREEEGAKSTFPLFTSDETKEKAAPASKEITPLLIN